MFVILTAPDRKTQKQRIKWYIISWTMVSATKSERVIMHRHLPWVLGSLD
jgi:hypothetical protein